MGVRAGRGPLGISAALPSLALGSLAGLPSSAAERTKGWTRAQPLGGSVFPHPPAGPELEREGRGGICGALRVPGVVTAGGGRKENVGACPSFLCFVCGACPASVVCFPVLR